MALRNKIKISKKTESHTPRHEGTETRPRVGETPEFNWDMSMHPVPRFPEPEKGNVVSR